MSKQRETSVVDLITELSDQLWHHFIPVADLVVWKDCSLCLLFAVAASNTKVLVRWSGIDEALCQGSVYTLAPDPPHGLHTRGRHSDMSVRVLTACSSWRLYAALVPDLNSAILRPCCQIYHMTSSSWTLEPRFCTFVFCHDRCKPSFFASSWNCSIESHSAQTVYESLGHCESSIEMERRYHCIAVQGQK